MKAASSRSLRPCQVIAAVNANHNGDPELARRLVEAAREAGADGIKFQKRTVTLSAVRQILDRPTARHSSLGSTYRKALERLDMPVEALARLCEDAKGLLVLVAPYDVEAYQQLEGVPFTAWKVDPPLAVHLPLLGALGASGRPVAAGVAGCTQREVEEMIGLLAGDVTLIHTLFLHPFTGGIVEVAHLVALRRFGRPVGYADNSLDLSPSLMAVAFGATMVEKPLTLDRAMAGPDHATSLVPQEFGELVRKIRALEAVIGSRRFRDPSPDEMDDIEWSRVSVVAARPIPRGARITREMLTLKPPARGLAPRFLTFLEGRRALYDVPEDEFLTFGMVEL